MTLFILMHMHLLAAAKAHHDIVVSSASLTDLCSTRELAPEVLI